jgi:acyl-CoA dehydrogenase
MGGIAFGIPDDVMDVREGVLRFVETQVAPRIERNRALLEDQRRLYDEGGAKGLP